MSYVLITGASRGIGHEMAHIFGENHYNLILVARDEPALKVLQAKLIKDYQVKVEVIVQDLTTPLACEKVYEMTTSKNLEVEILINNAGYGDYTAFLDSDYSQQAKMIDLNIKALMRLSYLYGNDMKAQGYGRIMNVASVVAFNPGPYMAVYYASKAFVLSFSQALTEEFKDYHITVTALCPGPTKTSFSKTANFKKSGLFNKIKPMMARKVAKIGYKACLKGKAVKYCGFSVHMLNLCSRMFPRVITRKLSKRAYKQYEEKEV